MLVVVMGSTNIDLIVEVPHIPAPGETILGNNFQQHNGGKGANQAVGARRLNKEVQFITAIGRDALGEKVADDLVDEGFNSDYFFKKDKPTGAALISVSNKGENSISVASGANGCLEAVEVRRAVDAIMKKSKAKRDAVFLTQLETSIETVEAFAEEARKYDACFILNPAPARKLPEALYKNIDLITPNETEVTSLTGIEVSDDNSMEHAAKWFIAKGVKQVIITLGARGYYVFDGNSGKFCPCCVRCAVDSTGAGDAFNGAMAVGLSQGLSIYQAAEFANITAAESVMHRGAQPSFPRLNALIDKISSADIREKLSGI
ncbi:MAG: ribokinase [Francisellaceae bacterium]